MQCEIVEYGKDPGRFGMQVVNIIASCYFKIATEIELDPSLCPVPVEDMIGGPLPEQLIKASEHAAINWQGHMHQWERSLKSGKSQHLVAVGRDGNAVGFGTIDISGNVLIEKGPEICNMYVAPSKQNMGIGSEILTRLEEYASERVQKEIGEWKVHGYSLLYRPTLDFYSKRDYDIFPDEMTLWGQDGFLLPSVPVRKRSFQTR